MDDVSARTVVVGLDRSEEAEAALRWARCNTRADARIVALHAWELQTLLATDGPERAAGVGFQHLAEADLDLMLDGVCDSRIVRAVRRGRPGEVLVDESGGAALVVVGHRGDSRMQMMLGSTANYLVHRAGCPVVIVRGDGELPARRVVVGIDAYRHGVDGAANESVNALRWAYRLPHVEQIHLLNAWFVPAVEVGMFTRGIDVSTLDADANRAIDLVVNAAGPAPSGIEVTRQVAHAASGEALVDASAGADLVVVGSRGRGALRGLLLGSTSAEVAARAHSSVAVVRPRTRGPETLGDR